jgi:hypothetical protein
VRHTLAKFNIIKMNILMFDEVGYFWLNDYKLPSLRPSDMSDPSVTPQRYTKQKKLKNHNFFIFVYNMIKNGVSISEKFVCLMMKPTSKSISALLKLELTNMNLSSIKIPRKRKNTLFFHPGVSIPVCKPTTCKYSLS